MATQAGKQESASCAANQKRAEATVRASAHLSERLARPATPGPCSPVDAAQTPFFVQKHERDVWVSSYQAMGAARLCAAMALAASSRVPTIPSDLMVCTAWPWL